MVAVPEHSSFPTTTSWTDGRCEQSRAVYASSVAQPSPGCLLLSDGTRHTFEPVTIALTLLGLQSVRDADGRELGSLAAQPKRFALLAYLAIAGGAGYHRRDALTAMFWPELDQQAARRALRNTLYHLREAIGDGVLITRGDDAIAIDPASLTCDVTKLSAAVAEGRFEDAVDYYRGELLAGVHFPNAGESFEEWLSRERARTVGLVLEALRALVAREETAGNVAIALRWAQRACALAPDDEGWLRRAMSLLYETDDRGSALRLYESYERRLAAEFNSRPTAESSALAARIRSGDRPARANESPARSTSPVSTAPVIPAAPAVLVASPVAVASPAKPRALSRRSLRWAGSLVAVAIVIAVAGHALASRLHSAPARTRALVDVFENRTGDPHLESLGRMAEDWLSQGLLRTQLVDVVDQRAAFVQGHATNGDPVDPLVTARRTGATLVVSGNFYRTGDTILFQAGIVDVPTGRILRAVGPIFATASAPLGALDELRSRVMSALASVVNVHAPDNLADRGSVPRFDAYQAYIDGSDAYAHGDFDHAKERFLTAVRLDSSFIAAAVAAAAVAANTADCAFADSIASALNAGARHLDRIERLSTQIDVAHCHGRRAEVLRLTLDRAELEPRTSSFRMSAAAAALWANQPERALQLIRDIDPRSDLAWNSDSTQFAYWSGYTESLHLLGRHAEELAITDRVPAAAPLTRAWLRGRALAALSRPAEALALMDTALTLTVETANDLGLAPYTIGRPQYTATPAWVAVDVARELAAHGNAAAARQAAERALAWYRARSTEERSTFEERLVTAMALDMTGANADATSMLRALAREDTANIDYKGLIGSLAAERADTALVDSIDGWLAHQTADQISWVASYYRARNEALLGRQPDARARLRDAMDQGAWPMYIHGDPAFSSLRVRPTP
jgi:DNA-binding SARP family transcriptional activator/TolB-like protein